MKINVNSMSRNELLKLQRDVEKALSGMEKKHKEDAKKALEDAAKKFGFTVDELVGKKKRGARAKSAPKYANPADKKQTWSGRGRQPAWVKQGLAKGKTLDDFAI